jgi:hypothetical protein
MSKKGEERESWRWLILDGKALIAMMEDTFALMAKMILQTMMKMIPLQLVMTAQAQTLTMKLVQVAETCLQDLHQQPSSQNS